MNPKAILIDNPGGPEVMQWREMAMPQPGPGEILIRQKAIGLNYIDVYHRSGLYGLKAFPSCIGLEGAGIVEKAGPGCQLGLEPGTAVCYAGGPIGAYAEYRVVPERQLIRMPDGISHEQAAAAMVKGLTAHYLLRRTFLVDGHTTMLVHAAAGGVGLILCQWGKLLGAKIIGTVGSAEKAALAADHGCDYPINYQTEDFVARVREITGGRGCNVVYDSVGQATFMRSLECLMPFGMMVSYGQSSGSVAPFDINELQKRGSLFLTRPSLEHYIREQAEYMVASSTLLGLIKQGRLRIPIHQRYELKDAVRAHQDLEARRTTGASIFYTGL